MQTILGIDPGRMWGWAVVKGKKVLHHGSKNFISLVSFQKDVYDLIQFHKIDAVITCRAMGPHAQVTRFHAAMAAVVEIYCELHNIPYFDVADNSMRKVVIGNGAAKKADVMRFCKIPNEHAADAVIAGMFLTQKGEESTIPA